MKIRKLADCPAPLTEEGLKLYKDSGINTYVMTEDYVPLNTQEYIDGIKLCEKVGLDVFIRGYNREDYFDDCTIDFNQFNCVKGFYLWDEPNGEQINGVAQLIPFMHEKYPDKFWHVNLFPSYGSPQTQLKFEADEFHTAHENYVNSYIEKVLSKVKNEKDLSVDYYPIGRYGHGELAGQLFIGKEWLEDLYTCAIGAKTAGAQIFNTCIQAYNNISCKGDIALQIFVCLAFGAKSFEYYRYIGGHGELGMIINDKPSPIYYAVQAVNKDLEIFEEKYMEYDWKGVSVISPKDSEPIEAFKKLDGKAIVCPLGVKSVSASTSTVIGSLVKDGSYGYSVVNFNLPEHKIKDKVVFEFESVGNITVYKNGVKEEYSGVSKLELDLNEGEGAFITFDK